MERSKPLAAALDADADVGKGWRTSLLTGMSTGRVENHGRTTVKDGGLVLLAASRVVNSGMVQADGGRSDVSTGEGVAVFAGLVDTIAANGQIGTLQIDRGDGGDRIWVASSGSTA